MLFEQENRSVMCSAMYCFARGGQSGEEDVLCAVTKRGESRLNDKVLCCNVWFIRGKSKRGCCGGGR